MISMDIMICECLTLIGINNNGVFWISCWISTEENLFWGVVASVMAIFIVRHTYMHHTHSSIHTYIFATVCDIFNLTLSSFRLTWFYYCYHSVCCGWIIQVIGMINIFYCKLSICSYLIISIYLNTYQDLLINIIGKVLMSKIIISMKWTIHSYIQNFLIKICTLHYVKQ